MRGDAADQAGEAGIGHVELLEVERAAARSVLEIGQGAAGQIVDADNRVTIGDQPVADIGTDETGRTGHEHAHCDKTRCSVL